MMIKIQQPHRNPGDFACYLAGVKAAVDALAPENYVDALAFGGGIPTELTITTKPEPVVTTDVYAAGEETAELPTVEAVEAVESDAQSETETE